MLVIKSRGKQEAADAALRVLIGEAEKAARTGELHAGGIKRAAP